MRALLVVSKAQATVRALSIRKAGATTLTLLAVSLCGPEPGTVWRARRAVAFYDRRQDTRAGAIRNSGPQDAVSAAKPLDNTPHLFAIVGAKRDGPNGSHGFASTCLAAGLPFRGVLRRAVSEIHSRYLSY